MPDARKMIRIKSLNRLIDIYTRFHLENMDIYRFKKGDTSLVQKSSKIYFSQSIWSQTHTLVLPGSLACSQWTYLSVCLYLCHPLCHPRARTSACSYFLLNLEKNKRINKRGLVPRNSLSVTVHSQKKSMPVGCISAEW